MKFTADEIVYSQIGGFTSLPLLSLNTTGLLSMPRFFYKADGTLSMSEIYPWMGATNVRSPRWGTVWHSFSQSFADEYTSCLFTPWFPWAKKNDFRQDFSPTVLSTVRFFQYEEHKPLRFMPWWRSLYDAYQQHRCGGRLTISRQVTTNSKILDHIWNLSPHGHFRWKYLILILDYVAVT